MAKLTLYHYSNKNFTGNISPAFFGDNSYSLNSASVSGTKRAFFYLEAGRRECYLDGARALRAYIKKFIKNFNGCTVYNNGSALYTIESFTK